MNKLKNNKGITLLELIIAIAIMSTIIFIGYRVIDTSNKEVREQAIIFNEQQSANILNEYLSKDLEKAKSVEVISQSSEKKEEIVDGYKINTMNNEEIIYSIDVTQNAIQKNIGEFSIYRDSIEIVTDMKYSVELQHPPLIISTNDEKTHYEITMLGYENKFTFKVAPRIGKVNLTTGPQEPPDEGDDLIPVNPSIPIPKAEGNIVIYEHSDGKEVTINSNSEGKDKFKNEISVRNYKTLGDGINNYDLVVKSLNEDSYMFYDNKVGVYSNEKYIELKDNDTKQTESGDRFKVDIGKNNYKIYLNDTLILRRDDYKDDNEIKISLFNASNDIYVSIEDDDVDIEIVDKATDMKLELLDEDEDEDEDEEDYDIDIEIEKSLIEGINKVEMKGINNTINVIETQSPDEEHSVNIGEEGIKTPISLYYENDDDDADIKMKTEIPRVDSKIIVNFLNEDTTPPPDGLDDFTEIGFWTADNSKIDNNNLATWISRNGALKKFDYGTQNENINEFGVNATARPKNNGYIEANISENQEKIANINQILIDKDVSKVMLYISAYTTLEITDFKTQVNSGNGNNNDNHDIEIVDVIEKDGTEYIYGGLQGRWYECNVRNNGNINNLTLEGKISINKDLVESGYALLVYGN